MSRERIAIVGMAGRFPGSGVDLEQFWNNVSAGKDCSREVPSGRWLLAPEECYHPEGPKPDSVYSTRGYYLEAFEPDLSGMSLPSDLVQELDPLFHLVLDVGNRAWQQCRSDAIDRRKVGVILGNICLPTEKANDLCRQFLGGSYGLDQPSVQPLNRYVAGLPAGLLARGLQFGACSFTLDAACASSLYALKLASDELLSGRADAMLAGGCNRADSLYTQMGFAQLRALSQSGKCSPFDSAADGLMVGEGAGIFVLKRLSDAIAHGDTIHAVLSGWGLSNDIGANLLSPAKEGQLRAMESAYDSANWLPSDVDLIECHATGTPVGDAIEFESLCELWRRRGVARNQKCVIGSVKSSVGHLLTGAGAAAVMKVILALKARMLPAQANFANPGRNLNYDASPFQILNAPQIWEAHDSRPRRAAVSGFGFGGVNGHLLFEEATESLEQPSGGLAPQSEGGSQLDANRSEIIQSSFVHNDSEPIAIVGMAARASQLESLRAMQEFVLGGPGDLQPEPKRNGWSAAEHDCPPAYAIEEITVLLDRFRIPPKEIEEMLPQQLLILQAAVAAWDDLRSAAEPTASEGDPKTGVFVGLGLDLNTTNYHLRWAVKHNCTSGSSVGPDVELDTVSPALNANRVMGSLGSIAASRIARLFQFGGPSFTVCSEETSSARALELAVRALRAHELDHALVGGVDFTVDPRVLLPLEIQKDISETGKPVPLSKSNTGMAPGEAAAAVVLKRLSDAERDGDRIYCVIRGVGSASGGAYDSSPASSGTYATSLLRACSEACVDPATLGYFELATCGKAVEDSIEASALAALLKVSTREIPLALGTLKAQLGHTGFASSLLAVVKSSLVLYQQILPFAIPPEELRDELEPIRPSLAFPRTSRFWLQDQHAGPRRAAVASLSVDGTSAHAVLEEYSGVNRVEKERLQPLGARHQAVFVVEGESPAELIDSLGRLSNWLKSQVSTIEKAARDWLRRVPQDSRRKLAVSFVSRSVSELQDQLEYAQRRIAAQPESPIPDRSNLETHTSLRDQVFFNPYPMGKTGKLAFVFPGSGNQFAGMGRELGVHWPEILRRQQLENQLLRSQYAPNFFWDDAIPPEATPSDFLFGQVALGTLVADLLTDFGVRPAAMIGQSLGESSGLFGTRLWTSRDEMLQRIRSSTLFRSDLGPPYDSARRYYQIPDDVSIDWVSGLLAAPSDEVREQLRPEWRAYLLIITSPGECVVGGFAEDVRQLVAAVGKPYFPLSGVTLAHCEAGKPVEHPYRELHRLPVTPASGIRVYSAAWGKSYEPDEVIAADSITAGLLNTIDFPRVIDLAYSDGVRFFIEVGPGNSSCRMISSTLGDRPHVARAICAPRQDPVAMLLRVLAQLSAERVHVDLSKLYSEESLCVGHQAEALLTRRTLTLKTGSPAQLPMALPMAEPIGVEVLASRETEALPKSFLPKTDPMLIIDPITMMDAFEPDGEDPTQLPPDEPLPLEVSFSEAAPTVHPEPMRVGPSVVSNDLTAFATASLETQQATAEAHGLFLKVQSKLTETAFQAVSLQSELIRRLLGQFETETEPEPTRVLPRTQPSPAKEISAAPPRSLTFEQCMTFATGKIADVLGPMFEEVDRYPTRVRLPDYPLMLVDRILQIEGEPKSMTSGRVLTDHQVHSTRWYLDNNCCPTSVTVEAGQADLFLSGYLGIDFVTRGLAVYRLLDAVVTFHRHLPRVGERIDYDIHIDEFFHQGETWLFRFRFEGTIAGQPLLSMKNGIAGFFTEQALAAGQGIVQSKLDLQQIRGKRSENWKDFTSTMPVSLDESGVEELHKGDYVAAFGEEFELVQSRLKDPLKLPAGMLRLVDRVPALEPQGGRYGLGFVRAEYDIQPEEWFIECHFVDDKVMPGTLMYECCLHTLRILLMRMGWVGEHREIQCEPVPGVQSRLKCRGQVLASTSTVTYEVSVKELGYRPEPFAIADALMYADGKPIVEITNLSLRMSGSSLEKLEFLWNKSSGDKVPQVRQYDSAKIMAYSNGKPSEAFGEPYRIFDTERVIARLPGPPFQFLDRITSVHGEPFVMQAGAHCEAEYHVPAAAWYFEENRAHRMPFSVLLEIALQPCGWLAAYCGSALTSPVDLSFRNLGGEAVQYLQVTPETGLLKTHVAMTKVSQSAGMIIQHYSMKVVSSLGLVYEGTTYFGFFSKDALRNQVGITNASVPYLSEEQRSFADHGLLPAVAPFPAAKMRMVDRIVGYLPHGGKKQLGLIEGRITVDPEFWFFKAHFFQDPVWPGSLGLESFLQLLKYVAWKKWGSPGLQGWQTPGLSQKHSWTYRGQVLPQDRDVTVVLEIIEVDNAQRKLKADGFLTVDGRVIYQMSSFTLE